MKQINNTLTGEEVSEHGSDPSGVDSIEYEILLFYLYVSPFLSPDEVASAMAFHKAAERSLLIQRPMFISGSHLFRSQGCRGQQLLPSSPALTSCVSQFD